MRIIQTVNDTIRLLFNPKTEIFRLSDFLLVRDVDENFLAQVIEVYDDKFDQEANVAKIKLIYRIVNGNEIEPFDNYTPSRECEVAKIKQSEIEKCINLNRKTITLGKSYFSKEDMQINTDFLENNCVIFADKFEQTNQIFENLAPRLTEIKPVLILDFSGNCKIENISPYIAGENFKLPLSSSTIDYIQQKTLIRAKIETQVVLSDVFDEVKKFLETSEEDYIPFQRFIKVIKEQCRKTPSVELLVLISWLKKYSRENIFAKTKREYDGLFKSLNKNKITILDLSNIKTEWQKEFLEYIISAIQNDVFVLIRLNDNNINNDIINKIYLKKKNLSLIPSFAYGYKKAPYIMDFAQNYILMPTLNPKRDFTHANFQIQSLNKEAYLIFGDDTKDFIFTLENEDPIKKAEQDDDKNKVFISLNLQLEDMTPLELRPNNFEIKQQEPRKKRLQEEIKLSDVLSVDDSNKIEEKPEEEKPAGTNTEEKSEEAPEKETAAIKDEPEIKQETIIKEEPAEFIEQDSVVQPAEIIEPSDNQEFFNEDELDYFEQANVIEGEIVEENDIEENEQEAVEENQPVPEVEPEIKPDEEDIPKIKVQEEEDKADENSELTQFAINQEEPSNNIEEETDNEAEIEEEDDEDDSEEEFATDDETEENSDEPDEPDDTEEDTDNNDDDEDEESDDDEIEYVINPEYEEEGAEIKETDNAVSTIIDEIVQENIENKIQSEEVNQKFEEIKTKEDIELDEKFDEILNNEEENEAGENSSFDVNTKEESSKKEITNLPVFDEDKNEDINPDDYTEGKVVAHEKYGIGTITKVIQYGERCLLQIEFEEVGKRLLDPKIAKLEIKEAE